MDNIIKLGPRRRSGFSPLNFGSDLALWLDPSYGVYTDRSTQLTAASSQYWSVASNATLQTGDVDFWVAGWVFCDSVPTNPVLLTKGNIAAAATFEYTLFYSTASSRLRFALSDGASFVGVDDGTGAAMPTGEWRFVICLHDAANDLIGISVNGGAFSTAATGGLVAQVAANAVTIGSYVAAGNHDGRLDSVMFGKSPVGGIAALATTIRDYLYNSGAGRVYADLSAAQATAWGLVSAWDFDGDGLDAHGSNDLTAVNSPTYTSGIASGVAGDGDVVSLVDARTGPNCGPPSYAGRPLWVANAGKPYISFDGVNDGLQTASNISLGAFTIAGNFYASGTAGILVEHSADAGANAGTYLYGTTGATVNARRTGSSAKDLSSDWAVDSTWRTIVHSHNGTHATHLLRLNGVSQTLADVAASDVGTASVDDKLNIASRNQASLFSAMRLGDLFVVNRVLTAGELSQLESWLASRRSA